MGEIASNLEPGERTCCDTERAPAPDWVDWGADAGEATGLPRSGRTPASPNSIVEEAEDDDDPTEPFARPPMFTWENAGDRAVCSEVLGIPELSENN